MDFNYFEFKNEKIEPFFPQEAACVLLLAWHRVESSSSTRDYRMVDELVDVTH